ncbi:MAG: hypothetical protein EON51_16235 [Acinetobacter sp.]|nr:MAG: hypothetical protein EON51_16235 [Acinetobacter sp.]
MRPIIKNFNVKAGFPAIYYNMQKVSQGTAEIVACNNFGIIHGIREPRSSDYENYLAAISSLNHRTKSDQFHAMICAWKRTMSEDDLKELGERWISEIGFGNQPYLIFSHRDTEHNHIHLVSCKIRIDGTRVDTTFIRLRSMRALHKLIGVDREADFKREVSPLLSYSFTDLGQLSLLLRRRGYHSSSRNGKFCIYKYGESLLRMEQERFSQILLSKAIDESKISRLRGLINAQLMRSDNQCFALREPSPHGFKNKVVGYHSELSKDILKDQNIEIVYHFFRETITGYTVIDHHYKTIVAGERVMDLDRLVPSLKSGKQHKLHIQSR